MQLSDRLITFCIFPHISRHDEAIVFRTINAKQKGISTSLVGSIIKVTDPNASWHLRWAWDLDSDYASPFYRRVNTGGRGRRPETQLIWLAGLNQTLRVLAPQRVVEDIDYGFGYDFVRAYWRVIRSMWPGQFEDKNNYKLQTSAGQRGLAQFGQYIFRHLAPVQDPREATIRRFFTGGANRVNWRSTGPLRTATGKGGQRQVFETLRDAYGLPR